MHYNTPLPEIEIKNSGVMVKCHPSKTYMDLLSKMKDENVHKNVLINVHINGGENLTKTEKQILEIILDNPEITYTSIADIIDTTQKTVQRAVATLKEKGIIERIGSNKKGYWKLNL